MLLLIRDKKTSLKSEVLKYDKITNYIASAPATISKISPVIEA